MGSPVVANILKSGAIVWKAPVAEAVPDETTVTYGAAWGGNWARVGYTAAPLVLAYESEEADIEVEEELAPVGRSRIKEGATIETVLAELTAGYMQMATGEQAAVTSVAAAAGQRAYEEMGVGGVTAIAKAAWGFEGQYVDASGNSFPVRVFVWIATAKLNGALEFSKKTNQAVGIPLQVKALADTSQAAGLKLFKFQRVTAKATDE